MALPQAAKAPTNNTKINVLILDLPTSSAFNLQIFPVGEIIASLGADRKRGPLDFANAADRIWKQARPN